MAVADIQMNQHFERLGIYALGFLDSASALFRRAEEGTGLVDYAIYPAAFCLRHGLELFIKQMSVYAAYETNNPGLLYVPGHELEEAWLPVRRYMSEAVEHDSRGESSEFLHALAAVATT